MNEWASYVEIDETINKPFKIKNEFDSDRRTNSDKIDLVTLVKAYMSINDAKSSKSIPVRYIDYYEAAKNRGFAFSNSQQLHVATVAIRK